MFVESLREKGDVALRCINILLVIPFLNQTLTLSATLCGVSPYSLYCLVAAR
jgi:hypothetical protein